MTDSYVFDTYAIIEIIRGNPKYNGYLNSKVIITEFILAELCFNLIRELEIEKAFYYVDRYSEFVVTLDKEIIKKAMIYRYKNLKKNLSMTNCAGYFLAKELGLKFLTGDKEFENLENVELVKK